MVGREEERNHDLNLQQKKQTCVLQERYNRTREIYNNYNTNATTLSLLLKGGEKVRVPHIYNFHNLIIIIIY